MMEDANNVRIITTLGHVDHGKTTLMDALLAANNIISPRMAGKMRYLDSREDEQERGITMESSAISLKFQVIGRGENGERSPRTYVINMVDTPGHVDFSFEVSTASRLCDGALVLLDVVEGVCTQTIAVLRQSWQDRLRPILVMNKMDRLITELKLSPLNAYHHLSRLLEQVNAVMGSFFAGERMADDLRWREEHERRLSLKKGAMADDPTASDGNFLEKDDEDIYFAPERGNVVFASAMDGWGFRVGKFAQLIALKLGFNEASLRKVLWGDFYLDPKTKKVIGYKHLRGRSLKPLFVQFVLENLWAVYDAVSINPNPEKITKIVAALDLKIPARDLKSKDARHLLSLILSQWLPLSTCIIQAVIDIVPAPSVAQATRIPKILNPELHEATVIPKNKLEGDLFSANSQPSASISAFVSKLFVVPVKDFPEHKKKHMTADEMRAKAREKKKTLIIDTQRGDLDQDPVQPDSIVPPYEGNMLTQGDDEVILGFARLYSGTIRTGIKVHCVLPKYNASLDPTHPHNLKHLVVAPVEGLYVMMGRELVAVDCVRAGNIFAIRGLEGRVWRSATLCAPSENGIRQEAPTNQAPEYLINLGGLDRTIPPIVRVAVEPSVPADLPKLISGLKLLSQSDPCVRTLQQSSGEYVILTAGELHLERCLKDLRDRFARVEIQSSKPIVPFRETAVRVHNMAPPRMAGARRGTIQAASASDIVRLTIRAVPLPKDVLHFVMDNASVLKQVMMEHEHGYLDEAGELEDQEALEESSEVPTVKPEEFWSALETKCHQAGVEWEGIVEHIWAFGPRQAVGCILVDAREGKFSQSLRDQVRRVKSDVADAADQRVSLDFDSLVETGFQLATSQGPLCAEPVEGLAYFVEKLEVNLEAVANEIKHNKLAQATGFVISTVRDVCRNGLLDWSPRLMLAMYSCDIQASTDVLGKVYGVVAKRRGRIVAEEMKEGTTFFNVSARLPVVESFGFAAEIRKRTSGAASPQLIFSGYELLDQDPFWVPTTEEELEDLGEKADKANIAKEYMDSVRERKGLFVDRKLVEFAEKQRTLKR